MGAQLSALLGIGQTAEWISRKSNLKGKVAIVTGASSGIGLETARVLCKIGAKVYMGCRDTVAGEAAKQRILVQLGPSFAENLIVKYLDLSALKTVRAFAEEFEKEEQVLDYLILNAGVSGVPRMYTKEGFEWHLGVNFLGHFYLTRWLFPLMLGNERENKAICRIVCITCSACRAGKLRMEDLHFKSRKYSPLRAYSQSKLAVWLFVQELAVRLKRDFESNISVFAVDPGACDTALFRYVSPLALFSMIFSRLMMKNVGEGAATTIFACIGKRLGNKSGSYLEHCRVHFVQKNKAHVKWRSELWEKAEEMVGNVSYDSYTADKLSMGSCRGFGTTPIKKPRKPSKKKKTSTLWTKIRATILPAVAMSSKTEDKELLVKKSE